MLSKKLKKKKKIKNNYLSLEFPKFIAKKKKKKN